MIANLAKLCQRRVYDLISSRGGLATLIFAGVLLLVSVLHFGEVLLQWSTEGYHALGPPFVTSDNLAGRSYLGKLCPPFPIDIVYTWVNGSDPRLLAQLKRYRTILLEEETSLSSSPLNSSSRAHNFSTPSTVTSCGWSSCHLWENYKLLNCFHSSLANIPKDGFVVHQTNDSYSALLPASNSSVNNNCSLSTIFLTPDRKARTKLSLPGGVWITGRPFESKKSETARSFVSQLNLIFQHTQAISSNRKVGLFYFHDGCALLCQPVCNSTFIKSILDTFSSLSLSAKPLYIVWNDTGPSRGKQKSADHAPEDSSSRSRYEDNDELRYSLRSVDKYAPWIRRIYIVTNGQVPSWLRLNHSRLRIVTHADIFADSTHLPTFNSAAIEMHLHRIPGLSRYFVYMNDDVFFGAPVLPDDFFTYGRGHRVYLTWAVPNCRTGCPSNWLNDGYCDKACNYPECDFDAGDCGPDGKTPRNHGPYAIAANAWAAAMRAQQSNNPVGVGSPGGHMGQSQQPFRAYCFGACADAWLGDGTCDSPCNRLECAFDSGDCGDVNFHQLCSVRITNKTKYGEAIEIPPGVSEVLVDLSERWPQTVWQTGRFWASSPHSVRSVTLAKKYRLVVLLLYKNLNKTTISLSMRASENVTAEVLLYATTRANGTCPPQLLFKPTRSSSIREVHPTMLPYPAHLRGPDSSVVGRFTRPPSNLAIEDLESRLRDEIKKAPNSTHSHILSKSAQELELDWNNGFLTDDGYRFFMWELLRGSPLRVTADHRRHRSFQSSAAPSHWQKRRLLDIYADSLRHTNRLFHRAYGFHARKVPGHMPHFIDKSIVHRLERRFAAEWNETSRHRFRNEKDLQFAFTYFYFLMHEKRNLTLMQWLSEFDADTSGSLSQLEIRSLALKLWGLPFSRDRLNVTLANCTKEDFLTTSAHRQMPLSVLLRCPTFENISSPHLTNASKYKYEVVGESEIWFKMLNANLSRTEHHLDEIRTAKRKFMCLNDNIDHAGNPTEAARVQAAMRSLLVTMFPDASQFELANDHGFYFIEDWYRYILWRRTERTIRLSILILIVAAVMLLICRRQCLNWLLFPIRYLRRSKCRRRRFFRV